MGKFGELMRVFTPMFLVMASLALLGIIGFGCTNKDSVFFSNLYFLRAKASEIQQSDESSSGSPWAPPWSQAFSDSPVPTAVPAAPRKATSRRTSKTSFLPARATRATSTLTSLDKGNLSVLCAGGELGLQSRGGENEEE